MRGLREIIELNDRAMCDADRERLVRFLLPFVEDTDATLTHHAFLKTVARRIQQAVEV